MGLCGCRRPDGLWAETFPHLFLGTRYGSEMFGFQSPGKAEKPGGPNEEIVHLSRRVWFCSACWDLACTRMLMVCVFWVNSDVSLGSEL